jgi:hypothetical protein
VAEAHLPALTDGAAVEEGAAARALNPADCALVAGDRALVADVVGVAGSALLPGMAPWGLGTRTTLSGAP